MLHSASLLLVEDARNDRMEEAYSRAGLMSALYVAMSVSVCLSHYVALSVFIICSGVCACTEMLWICVLQARRKHFDIGGAKS